jgi:hypothetical protein
MSVILLGASARTDTFNADFYFMAATIIPIFFLALMLPGGVLFRYSIWVRRWHTRHLSDALNNKDRRYWRTLLANRGHDLFSLPIQLMLLAASIGEVSAVIALDQRHATPREHWWVLVSVIGLPVVTVMSALFAASYAWAADVPDSDGDS